MEAERNAVRTTVAVLALCVIGACSDFATDPEIGVVLRTDRDAYTVGESLTIILKNGFEDDVFYHWCGLELQRHNTDSDEWDRVLTYYGNVPCMGTIKLVPGASASFDFLADRPEITVLAVYRFRHDVQLNDSFDDVELFSNSFEILPAGEGGGP